jgi:hypothetical protein
MEYRGFRWGRHELYVDVYWIPEDLERALAKAPSEYAHDPNMLVFWSEAARRFPPATMKALRGFVAAFIAGCGHPPERVP